MFASNCEGGCKGEVERQRQRYRLFGYCDASTVLGSCVVQNHLDCDGDCEGRNIREIRFSCIHTKCTLKVHIPAASHIVQAITVLAVTHAYTYVCMSPLTRANHTHTHTHTCSVHLELRSALRSQPLQTLGFLSEGNAANKSRTYANDATTANAKTIEKNTTMHRKLC